MRHQKRLLEGLPGPKPVSLWGETVSPPPPTLCRGGNNHLLALVCSGSPGRCTKGVTSGYTGHGSVSGMRKSRGRWRGRSDTISPASRPNAGALTICGRPIDTTLLRSDGATHPPRSGKRGQAPTIQSNVSPPPRSAGLRPLLVPGSGSPPLPLFRKSFSPSPPPGGSPTLKRSLTLDIQADGGIRSRASIIFLTRLSQRHCKLIGYLLLGFGGMGADLAERDRQIF